MDAVLVTGAFGLIGSTTVKRLAVAIPGVVDEYLENTPPGGAASAPLPRGVESRGENRDAAMSSGISARTAPPTVEPG